MTLTPSDPLGLLVWPPQPRIWNLPGAGIAVEFHVPAVLGADGQWAILPAPQGSKRAFIVRAKGKPDRTAMTESSNKLKPWREHVAAIARTVWAGRPPLDGPLNLSLTFVLRRPKSTPKRAPTPPAIKYPDGSKLQRAVEDSLTGIIWHDDAQVVSWAGYKRLAELDETPGVLIRVEPET